MGIDITGLNENQFEFELNPNPATNMLLLESSMADQKIIYIIDIHGKVLREIPSFGKTQSIDCSTLASGTYFIKVQVNEIVKMKKLLIQH